MTDIVAANVSYSFNIRDKEFKGRRGFSSRGTISFGNGSLTYPSGGIPLTKAKIGLPRVLRSVFIEESNASLYTFEFDYSAQTIRIFQAAGQAVTGNVAAPTITLGTGTGANVNANLAIAVSNLSNGAALVGSVNAQSGITGVQAPAFTGDSQAAGRFVELVGASSVVQACVLEVDCEGY